MTIKTYSQLSKIRGFEERYEYLKLGGGVGAATFGFDRHLNQDFYASVEWKSVRREVIIRDHGCDLGVLGYEIFSNLLVHHMNPMKPDDILHQKDSIFDPEFLITTSHRTHNAIHYGDVKLLKKPFAARTNGDTKLW